MISHRIHPAISAPLLYQLFRPFLHTSILHPSASHTITFSQTNIQKAQSQWPRTDPSPPHSSSEPALTQPIYRNITYHASALTRSERSALRNQRGLTIWLTGLSASGKSTIAVELEHQLLRDRGVSAYRLDGDNIRFGLNKDLGFSEKDRNENIRRIAEVAKLFADSANIAITSFISPYKADRETARKLHEVPTPGEETGLPFVEVSSRSLPGLVLRMRHRISPRCISRTMICP